MVTDNRIINQSFINQEIEDLRQRLYNCLESDNREQILLLSQQLDILINKYMPAITTANRNAMSV